MLLNSHGGNDLKPVLRELYDQTPAKLFLCNWYTAFKDLYSSIFSAADDHAGEVETSLMLAYHPELVRGTPTAPWRPTTAGRPPRGSTRSIAAGYRSPGPGIS